MDRYPEITELISKFSKKEIHASHSGREIVKALIQIAINSRAQTSELLLGDVRNAVELILPNLPPYAPPLNAMHLVLAKIEQAIESGISVSELKILLNEEAKQYSLWSTEAKRKIASYTFNIIPNGASVFTFTLSETVLNSLLQVWERGKRFNVFVTESRPNNDGFVTAIRLSDHGIPVVYGLDACIPEFVSRSHVVVSGTEAVLESGNVICKVGTRIVALFAYEYQKPFYVLVDTMKFHVSSRVRVNLPLDAIAIEDLGLEGKDMKVEIGGHLFDETPSELIQSIVTEKGVISPQSCAEYMNEVKLSQEVVKLLHKARRFN